ncbi:hypothetical protein GN956_G25230 [Arapaima gigas]
MLAAVVVGVYTVVLERQLELGHRQYFIEVDLLLPGLLGARIFGLVQNRASQWNSALRVKYSLRGDMQNLRQECYMAQTLRNMMQANETQHLRVEHELHCSHVMSFNHKLLMRHEEAPELIQSELDLSYGKHWNEINNKRRVLLSQSFKNQSRNSLTSYILEFSLQMLEKHLNYRTQLLHSHMRQKGAESSTHLKVNYNDQLPLVAGLHWRELSKARLRRWEGEFLHVKFEYRAHVPCGLWEKLLVLMPGTFNMDTPWLYVYTAHKLNQPQHRSLQFSTEVTIRKWVTLRSLVLEGSYWEKSREREGRLHLYTPTDTYLKVNGWGVAGKQGLKASGGLTSAWTPALRGDLSLEGKKYKKALRLTCSYGRQNVNISASVITVDTRLRKRLVAMKLVLLEPKGLPVVLELEGAVEELKRNKELYQKRGTLRLRQPFLHLSQRLLLQETFTVDLRRSRYTLESRAILSGNKECVHKLTLSYQPGKPFLCSALAHPFKFDTIPQDSEVCITLHTNQSQQEVQGSVQVNGRDKLIILGQVQNISDPSQQGLVLQVNLTHLLQIQLPQSVGLQGVLCWKHSSSKLFGYRVTGKATVDHQQESQFAVQLNGSSRAISLYSSFSQPYSSAMPGTFQVHAKVERDGGHVSSSVHVNADREEQASLEADLINEVQEDTLVLGARAALCQRLVPIAQDLSLQLSANISAGRMSAECSTRQGGGSLQAQLTGTLEHRAELGVSIRGGLQHSLASLPVLPPAMDLQGALTQSQQFTGGQLTVTVGQAVYGLDLHHQGLADPGEQGMLRAEPGQVKTWLCVRAPGQDFHVNLSSHLGSPKGGKLHAALSHSFPQLLGAGVPSNSSMRASWTHSYCGLSMAAELLVGSQSLQTKLEGACRGQGLPHWKVSSRLQHHFRALLERGVPRAMDVSGCYQVESDAMSATLDVRVDQWTVVDVLLEGERTNNSVSVAVVMGQNLRSLAGVLPARFQMNCSGDATVANHLSGQCSGGVADQPVEMLLPRQFSMNGSIAAAGCSLHLDVHMESSAGQGAGLSLAFDCVPKLHLHATAQHTLSSLQQLGIPTHNSLAVTAQQDLAGPGLLLDITLGRCELRVQAHTDSTLRGEEARTSWTVKLTSHCLILKDAGLAESLELSGVLSRSLCGSALSCNFVVDRDALALQLSHSCHPTQNLTGALTHSISQLARWGLPHESQLVLTVPRGPGQDGTFLLKAGSCRLRASGDGFSLPAQSQFNGSLLLDDCALEVRADARVDGQGASVLLSTGCHPGPQLGEVLQHKLLGPLQYSAKLDIHVQLCTMGVSGGVQMAGRLEGLLLLHNNCTALEDLGAPSRVEGHGFLVMNKELVNSHISLISDDSYLRAQLTSKAVRDGQEVRAELNHSATLLRDAGVPGHTALSFNSRRGETSYQRVMSCSLDRQQISEEFTVETTETEVQVEHRFRHTVDSLRGWGMPDSNSVQAKLDFGEVRRLSVHSQLGDRLVIVEAHLKDTPECTEFTGSLEHSWAWLQEKGLPSTVEVLCSVQGSMPNIWSKACFSIDGEKLLASTLNISVGEGRLTLLLSLTGPPHLVARPLHGLDAAITVHTIGSQKHVSMDLYCNGSRVRVAGEVAVWGAGGREAKITLQRSLECEDMLTMQVEAWARLTDTQLRGSLAWNPKTNSSIALTVQGHSLPARKELHVKVYQNIPVLQLYLPSQLDTKTQVNHTSSMAQGLVQVKLGGTELQALGELNITEFGYKQAVEVNHSFPKLKALPKNIVLSMMYEGGNWTGRLQQQVVWGGQELRLAGRYMAPPEQETGTHRLQVQMTSTFVILPSECGLDIQLGRSAHRLLDSVLLEWKGEGAAEKVRALCSRMSDKELWEGRVELKQPFTPGLPHLHFGALSRRHAEGKGSSHQVQAVFPLVALEGCGSVAREGNSFSQGAELRWEGKRISQAMKYQRGAGGGHTLQLEVGADNVSPQPCPSHTFLVQVHSNGHNQLEHHLLLGLCPPQPAWSVSGYHRVGASQELLYSQTRLSVLGQSEYSALTLLITNSSTPQHSNISLHTELQVGNGALELGGSVLSSRRGGGLLVQAGLDHRERLWMQGTLDGRCLQAAAGHGDSGETAFHQKT